MLDGIPFGGPGRVVRKSDTQAQTIAQLTLNLLLPGATPCAITAASVGEDKDMPGLRIAPAAFLEPPFPETETAKADVSWEVPGKTEPRLA